MSENLFPQLSREVDQLGRLCGTTISQRGGAESFQIVEKLRKLVRRMHTGDSAASDEIRQLLAALTERELKVVTRGFTIFLELANLAEDRRRVRILRQRKREAYPDPARETVRAAIAEYYRRGISSSIVQRYVDSLQIELVLTAHPTEAKRRAVRRLLGAIRDVLAAADDPDLLPTERQRLDDRLEAKISKLWQTDFIRPWRPTVMQEVERGLRIKDVLWEQVPRVMTDLRHALADYYPKVKLSEQPIIQYGSWIGGDRDGNPFVTHDITDQTIAYLRGEALKSHLARCSELLESLCLSDRETPAADCLVNAIAGAGQRWPHIQEALGKLPPLEAYRKWLFVVRWRLSQTALATPEAGHDTIEGAYESAEQLYNDVGIIAESLRLTDNANLVDTNVQSWLDQIQVFGLHMARLDIRQDSGLYRSVINEVLSAAGLVPNIGELEEVDRRKALVDTMGAKVQLDRDQLSGEARETLDLFTLLRRVVRTFGISAIGQHILSMTRVPSDLLTIMWFWRWSEHVDGGDPRDETMLLPIVPLFETIGDLQQAPQTMRELLAAPAYREYLRQQDDDQVVMIGYSDSSKDGGYLAAQWALQSSQAELVKVAAEFDVKLTFFHGRGGSLARGGGPAAQGVLSLPSSAFNGALRITEQGEVLADRYDNPHIAHRHLEQLVWSVLTAVSRDGQPVPQRWTEAITELAASSMKTYRQMVDHPSFADFYRTVTPINALERLPIGSRPSKRKKGNRVEDLRAIPWVYSWTQCRAMLPAWYGLGSAVESYLQDDNGERLALLREMHAEWPFFQISIDRAEVALAQANMPIFQWYAELCENVDEGATLAGWITDEHARSRSAVLEIVHCEELLDRTPWLKRSIQVRNGYVDPLNLLQYELHRRAAAQAGSTMVELEYLTHLTIKGVSTGMRTTG